MISSKPLWLALSSSVALHAVFAYSLSGAWNGPHSVADQSIQIDFVRTQSASSVKAATPRTAPKKSDATKAKLISTPNPPQTAPSASTSETDFKKAVDEKIKKQLQELKKLEAPTADAPRVTTSMTSAELLNDPVKGKIFLNYFGEVKKKIQNAVYQKAQKNLYGKGSVCVGFVLNSEGGLEKITILNKGTNAEESLRNLAANCIRDSAPFGDFPKNLGPKHISFNITIFFDDTE